MARYFIDTKRKYSSELNLYIPYISTWYEEINTNYFVQYQQRFDSLGNAAGDPVKTGEILTIQPVDYARNEL